MQQSLAEADGSKEAVAAKRDKNAWWLYNCPMNGHEGVYCGVISCDWPIQEAQT